MNMEPREIGGGVRGLKDLQRNQKKALAFSTDAPQYCASSPFSLWTGLAPYAKRKEIDSEKGQKKAHFQPCAMFRTAQKRDGSARHCLLAVK
jgi:hypothetical protein